MHIPLAKGMPGLRRYTLSTNPTPVRGEPFYRVAELDWDDMEALRLAVESPDGKATAEDVERLSEWSPGVESMVCELEEV